MKKNIKKGLETFLLLLILYLSYVAFLNFSGICPKILKTDISLEKSTGVNPEEAVVIDFSHNVLWMSGKGDINIFPDDGYQIKWQEGGGKLVIMPKNFWKPGTNYTINFPGGVNYGLIKIDAANLNFSTTNYPEIVNFYPNDGTKNVVLGIEDPMVANFDKSVQNFFVKFELNPDPELTYINNPEKTQFKLMPKDPLKSGQQYEIKISVKYAKDSDAGYKEIFHGTFETKPPEPANWERDFTLRLEQARKFTLAKITTGKYIDINLKQQILSTFQDGKLLDSYLISSGKASMPTPTGNYKVENKTPRAWSKEYGLFMPWWNAMVPSGKFGIHELPEWPGGYKEGANHLGTPVSHGCIRLGVGPARIVYDWADIGTPVIIY